MADLARNRKAFHDYFIDDTFECGIALLGSEVKSCRDHNITMTDAYAEVINGEVFLRNVHISVYEKASYTNHEPTRMRKLLLNKREIRKLATMTNQKGFTLIPLAFYLKNRLIKVKLGVCRGKKQHDKRQSMKERDSKRTMQKAVKASY